MKHTSLHALSALLLVSMVTLHAAERVDVIANGGFEQGAPSPLVWKANPESVGAALSRDIAVKHSGEASGRIVTTNTSQRAWPAWEQKVTGVKEGQRYEASVWLRVAQAQPASMAYLSLDYRGADGKRVSHTMSRALYGNGDWMKVSAKVNIPSNTVTMICRLILHGPGMAWFDDASLVRVDGWEPEPRLKAGLVRLHPTGVVCKESFGGFGAEMDPWLWNELHRSKGVTDRDTELIAARVREMRLSLARIFVNKMCFNPSQDHRTFTWDSDGMRSLEHTLRLCQSNQIEAILCPVAFGAKPNHLWDGPAAPGPDEAVQAWSAVVEHLIKRKGFTCIRWWQVCNEPDGGWTQRTGYDFDRFVRIQELMLAEFKARRLPVQIIGSGDSESLQWFIDSVRRTSPWVGAYGGSRYAKDLDVEEVRERNVAYLAAMRAYDPEWSKKKYIVTEFGVRAPATTDKHNAYMRTFDCGLAMASLCLDQVALGVDAASIWCLHRIYYSADNLMDYGLWEFKDENWKPRPLWFSYSLFTRFMARGSRLSQVEVTAGEDLVKAMLAQGPEGRFLFVLNLSYGDVDLAAETGLPKGQWVRYTYDERVKQAAADRPLFEPGSATAYSGELRDRLPRRSLVVYQLR
jgi:alpha-galactosidase